MADKPWFPLFISLEGRRVVCAGGGRIAARRVAALEPFADGVTVVSPSLDPSLVQLTDAGFVTWLARPWEDGDLEGAELVLACTNDPALNAAICDSCAARGIPANDASDRSHCAFYFPGIARRGSAVVGVNAGGADHRLARRLRERIQAMLDGED